MKWQLEQRVSAEVPKCNMNDLIQSVVASTPQKAVFITVLTCVGWSSFIIYIYIYDSLIWKYESIIAGRRWTEEAFWLRGKMSSRIWRSPVGENFCQRKCKHDFYQPGKNTTSFYPVLQGCFYSSFFLCFCPLTSDPCRWVFPTPSSSPSTLCITASLLPPKTHNKGQRWCPVYLQPISTCLGELWLCSLCGCVAILFFCMVEPWTKPENNLTNITQMNPSPPAWP